MQAHHLFQWDLASGSLPGMPVAGVVYQYLAHQPRGHAIEVRAVLRVGRTLVDAELIPSINARGAESDHPPANPSEEIRQRYVAM
jgi:hypothetical protein